MADMQSMTKMELVRSTAEQVPAAVEVVRSQLVHLRSQVRERTCCRSPGRSSRRARSSRCRAGDATQETIRATRSRRRTVSSVGRLETGQSLATRASRRPALGSKAGGRRQPAGDFRNAQRTRQAADRPGFPQERRVLAAAGQEVDANPCITTLGRQSLTVGIGEKTAVPDASSRRTETCFSNTG
jgi:hypothetical protein